MNVSRWFVIFVVAVSMFSKMVATKPKDPKKPSNKNRKYSGRCKTTIMAEYELVFEGLWSSRTYPRMFPQSRQKARWSSLVGRSHSDVYSMWTEGKLATNAVQMFAENGNTEGFEVESQAFGGIQDVFGAAPINGGLGKTITNFRADGSHAKVSFIVKLIPSPDWFVGLDSLDLCERKKWRRQIVLNLYPMDAGTDRGLAFTSPNWPSNPRELIYRLSPSNPSHTASAFYYENMTSLPPIAKVTLKKVGEYKRRGKDIAVRLDQQNMVIFNELPDGSQDGTLKSEIKRPASQETDGLLSNSIDLFAPRAEALVGDVDGCVVSPWSEWSECSRTCGFGHQERRRTIVRRSRLPGHYCPVLREDRTCGSMKACDWDAFQILGRNG